jgi:hypothetical protein
MGSLDEAAEPLRLPVIASGQAAIAVHALLHHDPSAVIGDEEAVEIEVEPVLHRGAVDLGDEAARLGKREAVEADSRADPLELGRCLARMAAASAADMQAELTRERRQAPLQRADDAGGDARRVPVHPHHRPEGLEPERMRQTPQQLLAAVMLDYRLADDRAQPRHALSQPGRDTAVVQGQVGAAGSTRHAGLS